MPLVFFSGFLYVLFLNYFRSYIQNSSRDCFRTTDNIHFRNQLKLFLDFVPIFIYMCVLRYRKDISFDIAPSIFSGNMPYMFQNSINNSLTGIFGGIMFKTFHENLWISTLFASAMFLTKTVNILLTYFQKFF